MPFDPNALITPVATLFAVPLGWWLNTRSTARSEAKAERDALGGQADAMVLAVTELRAAVDEDRILWSNWKETLRAMGLAAMTGAGAASFTKGSDRRQLGAAMGGASWFLAQERTQQKTAASNITPKIAAVAHAAAPLLRHSDEAVRQTTEQLMNAAFTHHTARKTAQLESAVEAFGTAVRNASQPTARRRYRRRATRTAPEPR